MSNNCTDKDFVLIKRIKQGDIRSFETLVNRYKDVSLNLSYTILKNKEYAEDTVQEAFVKVYQKLNSFKFKSSFKTWLYRIVVNTSYNNLKKNQKYSVQEDIHIDESAIDKSSLDEEDQKEYINLALNKLNNDEALVLRLHYLAELTIKEIEKVTSFSSSKIKTSLHRGRNNLYFQLKEILGNEINDLL